MQNPKLDKNNDLSAITNPTLKNKFDDGRNGIAINTKDICICLKLKNHLF